MRREATQMMLDAVEFLYYASTLLRNSGEDAKGSICAALADEVSTSAKICKGD